MIGSPRGCPAGPGGRRLSEPDCWSSVDGRYASPLADVKGFVGVLAGSPCIHRLSASACLRKHHLFPVRSPFFSVSGAGLRLETSIYRRCKPTQHNAQSRST